MKVSFFQPIPELKPYVRSIWVFESPIGLPATDNSFAAPNGCPKLIFTYRNSLTTTVRNRAQRSREQLLYFVGSRDIPVRISSDTRDTGFIGLEFHPHGAFPIFGIPMVETANRLLPFDELMSGWGRMTNEKICGLNNVQEAILFIQHQLAYLLRKHRLQNSIVEYCVDALRSSCGLMAIADLEHTTGYSRRYIELLFKDYVGFSPKALARIFRFQRFYRAWARGRDFAELKDLMYDYYYDQAHFTKEFKRMTGFSPRSFTLHTSNEFGRRLSLR